MEMNFGSRYKSTNTYAIMSDQGLQYITSSKRLADQYIELKTEEEEDKFGYSRNYYLKVVPKTTKGKFLSNAIVDELREKKDERDEPMGTRIDRIWMKENGLGKIYKNWGKNYLYAIMYDYSIRQDESATQIEYITRDESLADQYIEAQREDDENEFDGQSRKYYLIRVPEGTKGEMLRRDFVNELIKKNTYRGINKRKEEYDKADDFDKGANYSVNVLGHE